MRQCGAAEGHDNHPSSVPFQKKGYHKTRFCTGVWLTIMRWPMQHTCKRASPMEIAYAGMWLSLVIWTHIEKDLFSDDVILIPVGDHIYSKRALLQLATGTVCLVSDVPSSLTQVPCRLCHHNILANKWKTVNQGEEQQWTRRTIHEAGFPTYALWPALQSPCSILLYGRFGLWCQARCYLEMWPKEVSWYRLLVTLSRICMLVSGRRQWNEEEGENEDRLGNGCKRMTWNWWKQDVVGCLAVLLGAVAIHARTWWLPLAFRLQKIISSRVMKTHSTTLQRLIPVHHLPWIHFRLTRHGHQEATRKKVEKVCKERRWTRKDVSGRRMCGGKYFWRVMVVTRHL